MANIRGLLRVTGAMLACTFSTGSPAAEIDHEASENGTEIILITGSLERGDEETFRDLTVKYPDAIVALQSPGGLLLPALEIGRLIRLRSYSTMVVAGDTCASSCALIWLAGTPRYLQQGARVGFHASYRDGGGQSVESGVANAVVGHYLSQLSLSEKAVIFATKASPYEVSWLDETNRSTSGIDFETISAPDSEARPVAPEQPPRIDLAPPPVINIAAPTVNAGPQVQPSLSASIAREISPNWQGQAPVGTDAEKLVTIVRWYLNRDGTLAGRPEVVRQEGITPANRPLAARHAEQAIRAVQLAAPFDLPDQYYGTWKLITFRFDQRLGAKPASQSTLAEAFRTAIQRPGMAENAARELGVPAALQPLVADHLNQVYRIPGMIDRLAQELSSLPSTGSDTGSAAREVSAELTIKLAYQGYARLGNSDVQKFFNVMAGMTRQMTDAECERIFRSPSASNGPVEFVVIARQRQGALSEYLALMRKAIEAELSQSPAVTTLSPEQAKIAEDTAVAALIRDFSAYPEEDRVALLEAIADPSKSSTTDVCRGYRVLFPTVAKMPGLVGDWYRRSYINGIVEGY